ncbi:MAG: Tex family protein [Bacteroidia bacterium]|nr:RNA-binding transcriptional accessory protein [Bacteroidia bacterium]MDW8157361.1 Tex family protein [Bacteroidia bacterium]
MLQVERTVLVQNIARRTQLPYASVNATVQLLEMGCTVPFIARYRKGQTGNMDEDQIRQIQKTLGYYKELLDRKNTILRTIEDQGKLTPELKRQIELCDDATELEDLYLPYKPKRKTKASIALEQGLGPLAEIFKTATSGNKDEILRSFINGEICTRKEAIQGAQYILAEEITENAKIRAYLRNVLQNQGKIHSSKKKTDHKDAFKFDIYDGFTIELTKIKPYQILAINRGEQLGILSVNISAPEQEMLSYIERTLDLKKNLLFYQEYCGAIELAVSRYLKPSLEREIRKMLTEVADVHAVKIFSQNLRNLLLQPPIAGVVVMGIDPGYASGCKVAIVDEQGTYLCGDVIYPTPPKNLVNEAEQTILSLIERFQVKLIAIGNGTASRETEIFIANLIQKNNLNVKYLIVSEAGASVYSASEIAKKEFPHLDAAQRGNISIARRVQDPLAELVKIDPKSLGVGLYQHDVDQALLASELEAVVESCVNEVGVELNTASVQLLSFVSGLNQRLAEEIVKYRTQNGPFTSRQELLEVRGIGEKTFEQCAGFLRIRNGKNPLDNTSIHPEAYEHVQKLAQLFKIEPSNFKLLSAALQTLSPQKKKEIIQIVDLDEPTFDLIVQNLAKPGRDPREDIPGPILRSDVLKLEDLKEGMVLKGTVRNVVDFGAFVDIGLKNDALLHVSKMSKNGRFIKNPLALLEVGDVVDVVIDKIEWEKERVALALA